MVSRNLHKLAAAARQFHSAASSTSGTTRDGSNGSWPALSLIGDFPDHRRERVTEFVEHQLHYPSPASVVSGQRTPSRVNSPFPSLPIVQSPIAVAPAVATVVTVLEPAEGESESDEDDEAEDEREYFDGLEELARDRILNRDYGKAIEFLDQAMARDIGTASTGNEFRELQTQLALCHFFQEDWRKAEPIVERLAEDLDEVACNLLHALALSYLSVYSLDSALKICRKAMNGKKRLLKTSPGGCDSDPESDYAETVALFTMIHQMSGDPIRAEIYHRRLPDVFEYKHPASTLDFIVEHPRLLRIVLGDDVPASLSFRARSTALQLPREEATNLCRKGTIADSPLRTRFAFFERYENDTSKHVVAGPCAVSSPVCPTDSGSDMDAADEISPIESSPGGRPLPRDGIPNLAPNSSGKATPRPNALPKRTGTRIFTSRRPRRPASDDDLGAGATQSPGTAITPSARWFKAGNKFGFTRSKTLLRRRTNDNASGSESPPQMAKRTKTLRLGTIELTLRKMSGPCQTQGVQDSVPGISPADGDEEYMTTSRHAHLGASAGPFECPSSPDTARPGRCVVLGQPGRPSDAASSRLPSLNTRVGSHTHVASVPPPELITRLAVGPKTTPIMTSALSVELPVTEKPLELHDHSLSPIDIINNYFSNKWESFRMGSPSGETSSSAAVTPTELVHTNRPSRGRCSAAGSLETTPISQSHVASSLAVLLGEAASVVASLPEATDRTKRLAAASELAAIVRRLEGLSNDNVLTCDLRSIVASLDTGSAPPSSDDASDSGYETGDQPRGEPRPGSSRASPRWPLLSPGAGETVSTGLSTPTSRSRGIDGTHACLRPTPSFIAGDDSKFTRREPETPDENSRGGAQELGPGGTK